MSAFRSTTTQFLLAAQAGDQGAVEQLFPIVYDELRQLARSHLAHDPLAQHLSATELVHEAYLRLIDQKDVNWQGRTHFFAIGSRVMRRILVDHARAIQAQKRGGGRRRIPLDEQQLLTRRDNEHVLMLEEALERLEQIDMRQAQIVEMRFFGGMTVEEVAQVLGVSKRTVEGEWTMIRAWLRRELAENDAEEGGAVAGDDSVPEGGADSGSPAGD